jgi:hypothetical protein
LDVRISSKTLPLILPFVLFSTISYLAFSSIETIWTPLRIIFLVIVPSLVGATFFYSFFFNRHLLGSLLIACVSVALSLFITEVFIALFEKQIDKTKGIDSRTKKEVVIQERAKGNDLYPVLLPKVFTELLTVEKDKVFPLAGVLNSQTVLCNETGQYIFYRSDKFGFRNPPDVSNSIEVALIGDSFTHGYCLNNDLIFADIIRKEIPNTYNFGFNGYGSLLELGVLKEFVVKRNPKVIIWVFYDGNDFEDILWEFKQHILKKYLKQSFLQFLEDKKTEIDKELRKHLDLLLSNQKEDLTFIDTSVTSMLKMSLKLWRVRNLLGLTDFFRVWKSNPQEALSIPSIRQVFTLAKNIVDKINSKLIVLYIPSVRTFTHSIVHPKKKELFLTFENLRIPFYDATTLFATHSNPRSLYFQRPDGHLTAEGNKLVAKKLLRIISNLKNS